jgi:hypothetical protein
MTATATRETVRVYRTTARSGRPSRLVIHAFCPCTLPGAPLHTGTDYADVIETADAIGETYETCKRSTVPEPTAAQPDVTLATRLVQTYADLVTEPADERTAWVELTVTNMDNAGAVRRDALAALVETLGGATDSYGVKNASGSGIYSFTIRALLPALLAEADDEERASAKELRTALKAQRASAKQIAAADATHRRDTLAAGLAVYTDAAVYIMTGTPAAARWTRENATVLAQIAAAVKDAAHARRTAAKADRTA